MKNCIILKMILILFAGFVLTFALAACSDDDDVVVLKNIVETARDDGRFTTLVTALQAADLAGTLSGEGPFTVSPPPPKKSKNTIENPLIRYCCWLLC